MLNESQQKPKPRRQHSTHKKKSGWNKRSMSKSKSKKGKEGYKNKISQPQERKKEGSTQGEYANFRIASSPWGGVAPRRNNWIAESFTRKAGKLTEKRRRRYKKQTEKRHDEKTKWNKKGNTENDKRERENEEGKKGQMGKGKRQGCPAGTMLVTWVFTEGTHHDDDGHTQASVCWACLLYTSPSPRD